MLKTEFLIRSHSSLTKWETSYYKMQTHCYPKYMIWWFHQGDNIWHRNQSRKFDSVSWDKLFNKNSVLHFKIRFHNFISKPELQYGTETFISRRQTDHTEIISVLILFSHLLRISLQIVRFKYVHKLLNTLYLLIPSFILMMPRTSLAFSLGQPVSIP